MGSLWMIFEKAGRKKWEGFIPVYNIYVWLKIIKKPWWWIFFFVIPFVNLVVAVGCNVETARLFGKYSVKDTLLSILMPWYYIPYLAFNKKLVVESPTDWTKSEDKAKRFLHDHLTLFFIAPFVGHALYTVFRLLGSKDKINKKTMTCEWTNALGFAIVAASIIRSFFFEAFTIPTGSMEKTMRVGDYLFVNKMKYGAKLPQTPISIPFVHNRIPGTFIPSFVEWLSMDYFRLPGYGKIEANDIMVFNWPVGDTVILHDGVIAHDYYAILRDEAYRSCSRDLGEEEIDNYGNKRYKLSPDDYQAYEAKYMKSTRSNIISGGGLSNSPVGMINKTAGIATLPIDKKENYIKRCVGLPGEKIEIKNSRISINGIEETLGEEYVFNYHFYTDKLQGFDKKSCQKLLEEFEIYSDQIRPDKLDVEDDIHMTVTCSPSTYKLIKSRLERDGILDTCFMEDYPVGFDYFKRGNYFPIFPNHPDFDWSRDNFGPLYIPEAGSKIELNKDNWILYRRVIEVYEGNKVSTKNGSIYINDEVSTHYTFKQNYYWLMGDNRHGSADSRFWGFVPLDHVVGTASFVWFSKHPETGIRWDRIFSFVK